MNNHLSKSEKNLRQKKIWPHDQSSDPSLSQDPSSPLCPFCPHIPPVKRSFSVSVQTPVSFLSQDPTCHKCLSCFQLPSSPQIFPVPRAFLSLEIFLPPKHFLILPCPQILLCTQCPASLSPKSFLSPVPLLDLCPFLYPYLRPSPVFSANKIGYCNPFSCKYLRLNSETFK